jgi:hypothetical protein
MSKACFAQLHCSLLLGIALVASALAGCGRPLHPATAPENPAEAQVLVKQKQATDLGVEAYVYAYPLVTMEMTRRVSTNTAVAAGGRAPMGQFAKPRGYPSA